MSFIKNSLTNKQIEIACMDHMTNIIARTFLSVFTIKIRSLKSRNAESIAS